MKQDRNNAPPHFMRHKLLDFVLILLTVGIGVFFFNLVRNNDRLELKTQVLFDEIGDTKEENQKLHDEIGALKNMVDKNAEQKSAAATKEADQSNQIKHEKIPRVTPLKAEPAKPPHTINFLLVGQHQRLADSIVVAAVDPAAQKITFFSIPRDLFVKGRKINEYLSLYGISEMQGKISHATGLRIDEHVIIDFSAFEIFIDALGGLDINVPKAIYDPAYPNGNGGYAVYSMTAGAHHMNGVEALKYARSRHSTSDFDRAKRQQQILTALHERVINFKFLQNLNKLRELYTMLQNSMETSISLISTTNYLQEYENYQLTTGTVFSTENFLYSTTNMAGQYILLPRGGDFGRMQTYIRETLE